MPLYVLVRIRGQADVHPDTEKTLHLLRLRRRYTAALYHSSLPGIEKMIKKAENWLTWGEIDRETLIALLSTRGRLQGDKPLTSEWAAINLGLPGGIYDLTDKLLAGEMHYHKLQEKGVKPFFRLHPPRGGFKGSIKTHYKMGGELGYRGPDINRLIAKML